MLICSPLFALNNLDVWLVSDRLKYGIRTDYWAVLFVLGSWKSLSFRLKN